jgi:large subunit ribosomal protein L30e
MVKKTTSESVNSKLALVMKSGKAILGYKSTIKSLKKGQLKAIFVASNTPSVVKAEINYYAHIAGVNVHPYTGSNIDLGAACGKYHRVSLLGISDPGDSDILNIFN